MADKIKVTLLRPLNGGEIGSTAEYDQADADRLAASGAVQFVKAEPAHQNKMDAAPANKATRMRKDS